MGCGCIVTKLFLLGVLGAAGLVAWSYLSPEAEITVGPKWFGAGQRRKDDETIKPFKINVPDSVLTDLKERLTKSRISHEPLEDSNDFQYGFNSIYLKEVKDYWLNKYDWRKHEAVLNSFPQFTTEIEGVQVHFIRSKPAASYKTVYPLLAVHGWPGNVQEFVKIIPMLNDPKKHGFNYDFAFEVIAPSIPGYGFSGNPKKTGFSQVEAARFFKILMNRLGYKKFYLQGGDWGSLVTSNLARIYPESVSALHVNINPNLLTPLGLTFVKSVLGTFAPKLFFSSPKYADYNFFTNLKHLLVESGYLHLQATKPDTVGIGLSDSPIGLAAYILEKFSSWTDLEYIKLKDGGLTKKFTMDELLTVVTIYWVQGNIANSQRFYKEYFLDPRNKDLSTRYCPVPTGHSNFKNEFYDQTPEELVKPFFNLQFRREHDDGGHFAAYEVPKTLAGDVLEFIKQQTTKKTEKKPEL